MTNKKAVKVLALLDQQLSVSVHAPSHFHLYPWQHAAVAISRQKHSSISNLSPEDLAFTQHRGIPVKIIGETNDS